MGKVAKQVKLWNRLDKDYKQVVRGEEVFIPAKGHIVCGRNQAIQIRGHCCGKQVPVQLEIEPIMETAEEHEVWIDHKTGTQFPSREALLRHYGVEVKDADAAKNALRYVCPVCEEAFADKDKLIAHMPGCLDKVKKPASAKKA